MLIGLYIFLDDDFQSPIYADPGREDLDTDLWEAVCAVTHDAIEGDIEPEGVVARGENHVGWKHHLRTSLTFVCVVSDDVKTQLVDEYLKLLVKRYFDEVDDPTDPERDGVEDVVFDVIPPWEDDD